MSQPLWQPRTDTAARLLGAGFFVLCSGLLAFQVKTILEDVSTHAPRVSYFPSAFGLGEAGALFGLFLIVRGLAGYTAVRKLQASPRGMKVFFIAALVVIGATLVGVQTWLSAQGYE